MGSTVNSAIYSKRKLFPKESTRRLCHRLGVDCVGEDVYEYVNEIGERLLRDLLAAGILLCEGEKKKTVKARHIRRPGPGTPSADGTARGETTRLEDYLNK
jgi:histone H3/H4